MRKLLLASAKRPVPPLPAELVATDTDVPKLPFVRQKINEGIPNSYMPHPFAPVRAGSLVAVYLSEDRCNELDLAGFHQFEPLLARVSKVLANGAFESNFLESQSVNGKTRANGLEVGYNGRWDTWQPFEDEDPPVVVLTANDIYASNFKLTSRSKLSSLLQDELKRSLDIFKGAAENRTQERNEPASVVNSDSTSDISNEII